MKRVGDGRSAPAGDWRRALAAGLSAASVFVCASAAQAQVLELGPSGAVVVYDRPSTFNAQGAVAIDPPRAGAGRRAQTHPKIAVAAGASGVSEDLIAAVAWSESRMRAGAVSAAGALGEMQLMPKTARELGVNPRDTGQNYLGGAAYLHRLLIRYDGDLVRTLAAYNAGPGAVDRYGGVPPYKETQAYVAAVLERLSRAADLTR